jgi:hypothetical protein
MQTNQFSFDQDIFKSRKEFGGSLLDKSHAKKARPINTQHAMHVVLRSPRNIKMVERTLRKLSHQFGITIYRYAIVGHHLHLLIRLSVRYTFAPFLRGLTGTIAVKVTGSNKLKTLDEKLWDFIPWSHAVGWGKAYRQAKAYVFRNEMEASGAMSFQPRERKVSLQPVRSPLRKAKPALRPRTSPPQSPTPL